MSNYNNDITPLANKDLRTFEDRITNCTDDATLSTILEDFSEHIEHTSLIDINEYKYINELIKSKRLELEHNKKEQSNIIDFNEYKESNSDNDKNNNNVMSSPAKVLTFNKGGFNPNSVNHSSYVNDTPPTTAVSGNRGLASSVLVVSGVIVTLIMYALLFIALVIK